MASIRDLKKRIGTVKNTQQTTKAMKMVSAAKLRRSQEAILSQRPYAAQINKLIQILANRSDLKIQTPLFKSIDEQAVKKERTALIVIVTSDRGLCGGFNSSIIKKATAWLKENEKDYKAIKFGFVGKKGFEFFKKRGRKSEFYFEFGKSVTFISAKNVVEKTIGLYLSGQCDEVFFIYSEFKNAITQIIGVESFLPVTPPSESKTEIKNQNLYLVKPSAKEVVEQLLKKNFSIQAFRVLLESQASEHGARMSAMESATKNAGEMITKLTLQFNKQRQAGITKELLEIIAGSESQKN